MTLTDRILSSILSNTKPTSERKIGIEVECFYYRRNGERLPVNSGDSFSSVELRDAIASEFDSQGKSCTLTIEPGGQLEWASPPLSSLFELDDALQHYMEVSDEICEKENLFAIDFSVEPIYSPDKIELIDLDKYQYMHNRFQFTGDTGSWMMRNTTSVQVNLDYSSLEEAEEMAYVADCLTPMTSIMFSHSPFQNGKPVDRENIRYKIWQKTDNERCGHLTDFGIVEKKGLVEAYSRLVQMVPAIFVRGTDETVLPFDGPIGKWLHILNDADLLSDENIQLALHQLFPHVRLKKMLEIRNMDRPPFGSELASVAFYVGLLYSETSRKRAYELVKQWTADEREQLQRIAQHVGMDVMGPSRKTIREWIEEFSKLSIDGLHERQGDSDRSEAVFFEQYLDTMLKGGVPTAQVQDQYWQRGIPVKDFILERYAGLF